MRGLDADEVAAEGRTRSLGRNMVRVRILRMPRTEVETYRKALSPQILAIGKREHEVGRDRKAPTNRPKTPKIGLSRKYHGVEKMALENIESCYGKI